MAKAPKSATKTRDKAAKKPARPDHSEAIVKDFEREGMGVAPKE